MSKHPEKKLAPTLIKLNSIIILLFFLLSIPVYFDCHPQGGCMARFFHGVTGLIQMLLFINFFAWAHHLYRKNKEKYGPKNK